MKVRVSNVNFTTHMDTWRTKRESERVRNVCLINNTKYFLLLHWCSHYGLVQVNSYKSTHSRAIRWKWEGESFFLSSQTHKQGQRRWMSAENTRKGFISSNVTVTWLSYAGWRGGGKERKQICCFVTPRRLSPSPSPSSSSSTGNSVQSTWV